MKTENVHETVQVYTHIIPYDKNIKFTFQEIHQFEQENGKISFSVLFNIKQVAELPDHHLEIFIVRFHKMEEPEEKEPDKIRERFSLLKLGDIALSGMAENNEGKVGEREGVRMGGDIWCIRQLVKWNFNLLPTNGAGEYAIAVSLRDGQAGNRGKLLDCAYFTVI